MTIRRVKGPGALALAAAGCDLPTSPPSWTTSWELLAVEEDVTTAELLPDGVRLDPRGFAIDSFAISRSVRLADVCELCTCFDGPIPALEITPQEWAVQLPRGVAEAELLTGSARLVMTNRIGFDLLDDGLGGHGRVDVELIDRRTNEVLERAELAGSWPPGDSMALEFALTDRRLHSGLVAHLTGSTPGSGNCDVPLDPESGVDARLELRDVVASSVSVQLSDVSLALAPRSVSLPTALAERLRPGEARVALDVELTSRLPTSAELDLSVAPEAVALFTAAASLHTPLALSSPNASAPGDAHGLYLLQLEGISESGRLHFAARTRITRPRVVRLTGAEWLRYRLLVRAEVPSR